MDAFEELFNSFSVEKRERLQDLFSSYQLTKAQRLILVKESADLELFQEGDIFSFLDFNKIDKQIGKRRGQELINQIEKRMHELRYTPTDYSTFFPPTIVRKKESIEKIYSDGLKLFGKCPCPVDGEKTRCCKLTTLDAAMQCSFGCSYCSVQAFYSENKIKVVSDLDKNLKNIDTSSIWHIGTGQASDSLLFGDSFNTLSSLADFAKSHSDIVIELKSKSPRNDFFNREYPKNMIFTWSLNAPTIIEKEEHLTASLAERLKSAALAVKNGNLVGFHIHPMIYFKGWEKEYKEVVKRIEDTFDYKDIVMISMGTLTFTKAVLQHLRCNRTPSRVLEIPLAEAAGKYSYTLDIKREMFSTLYSYFSQDFKDNIFFYLCMEDPSLWKPCLNREYSCDKDFELDMKKAYFSKISSKL